MRVSDIFVAPEFAVVVARAVIAPRGNAFVAMRAVAPPRPGNVAVRVRVTVPVRCGLIASVPARVATIFCARVCVAARVGSVAARGAVVMRDCVIWVFRPDVDDALPSRTAAYADALAKKPRIAPKIRIFFISDVDVSKICKFVAREK